MNKHLRRNCGSQTGSSLVLLTAFIVALFAFAALSLDVGNVLREQRKTSTGTDAGALGSVMLLTNSPQPDIDAVTDVATDLAGGNGVTSAEIAAGARNGYPGEVQMGIWRNGTFVANTTTNGRYNAVRVPARRTVPLNFAKVVGLSTMTPSVSSVAMLTGAGTAGNAIPFGVSSNQFVGKTFGDTMTLNSVDVGSGKQGKIDLTGYPTPGDWQNDMFDPNGCNCTVSVGPIPAITGNAHVPQTFNAMSPGRQFLLPVIDQFDVSGGSRDPIIVGFVLVELISSSGNGNGWVAEVRFLNVVTGTQGGGNCPPPCVQVRTLTE